MELSKMEKCYIGLPRPYWSQKSQLMLNTFKDGLNESLGHFFWIAFHFELFLELTYLLTFSALSR